MDSRDPYSRVEYRRLIAWPARIARERPLLERTLGSAPSTRLLDLGAGPGEHARFLASRGFEVVAVDRSPAMLEAARETPVPDGLAFVEGDLRRLDSCVEGRFGGAICLGNTLPHLTTEEDLGAFAHSLRSLLLRTAPLILQVLNYDRIIGSDIRTLPVNVRPGDGGEEIVFLRVMTPHRDGSVIFYPTTLSLRDDRDPPLTVERSRRVELRGWRRAELEAMFEAHDFTVVESLGGFDGTPFHPTDSSDLVLVVRAA